MTEEDSTRAIGVSGLPSRPANRRLAAGFASSLLPGAGQLVTRRFRKGLFHFALLCLLVCSYLLFRWPAKPGGILVLPIGVLVLCIWSAVDAAYVASRIAKKPSQWWLLLLLPVSMVGMAIHANWPRTVAGFKVYSMPSSSMEHTIHADEQFVVDGRYYQRHELSHRDLVAVSSPYQPEFSVIKRVIGLPGDTILGRDGRILVNGAELQEPYVLREGSPISYDADNFGPFTLPSGKLYVLGDNRNNSLDSRFKEFGFVDESAVRGKAIYTIGWFKRGQIRSLK